MVGLTQNLINLADAVGDECKSLRDKVGPLGDLTTVDKSSLVDAVNELHTALLASTSIDDAVTSSSKTWSSTKIVAQINAAISGLVNGAPGALDTLLELANAIGNNANFATDFATLQTNIGNTDADFVAIFQNGLL